MFHAYRRLNQPTGEFIDLRRLADKPVRLPFLMLRKIDTRQSAWAWKVNESVRLYCCLTGRVATTPLRPCPTPYCALISLPWQAVSASATITTLSTSPAILMCQPAPHGSLAEGATTQLKWGDHGVPARMRAIIGSIELASRLFGTSRYWPLAGRGASAPLAFKNAATCTSAIALHARGATGFKMPVAICAARRPVSDP
jgi:hypothetical protein